MTFTKAAPGVIGMLAGVASCSLALAGCSSGPKADILPAVKAALIQQTNQAPSALSCPESNFTGNVGSTTDCTVTFPGDPQQFAYRVQVLAVQGGAFKVSVVMTSCVSHCEAGFGGAGGVASVYRLGPISSCAKDAGGDPVASGSITNLSSKPLGVTIEVSFVGHGVQFATGPGSLTVGVGATAPYTTSMPEVFSPIPATFSCHVSSVSYEEGS
jgi:hypothetical protein